MQSKTSPTLPEDCIFEILRYLSAKDLARVSCTSSAWHRLSEKNSLWQRLCLERWSIWPAPLSSLSSSHHPTQQQSHHHNRINTMLDQMDLNTGRNHNPVLLDSLPDLYLPEQWYSTTYPPYDLTSWKVVYKERHSKDATVRLLLEETVGDSRNRMRHMDGIARIGMVHARDVLSNIIQGKNGEEQDLTRTYYARKSLKRLQRGWVLEQWRNYRLNTLNFPIWQGCSLMAMYSDYEMDLWDIDQQLQDLADEFLEISPLPQNLDHSSFMTSPTTPLTSTYDAYNPGSFSSNAGSATTTAITTASAIPINNHQNNGVVSDHESKLNAHYQTQINRLQEFIQFFTQEKGFKGNIENYYDPFNSFIDKVLERRLGIPISLSIVFEEIARRVKITGVELMGIPQHFLIRYSPQPLQSDPITSSSPSSEPGASSTTKPAPPTYFLDLFNPPHRLLSPVEYEEYLARVNVPRPLSVYKDLPTPAIEIFLRCLRNIILAVEQTGGAGRIGSEHQTSLYSGITQLLTLHPGEDWNLYVLWLKYLSNFWPEDVGFIRDAIDDLDRRPVTRGVSNASQNNNGVSQHVFGYDRGAVFINEQTGHGVYNPSTNETIKILRTYARDLEKADEVGEVGQIRRRRRPKVDFNSSVRSPSSQSGPFSPTTENVDGKLDQNNETDEYMSETSSVVGSSFSGEGGRRPEPKFYVGEVFEHVRYHYTGAIYGYDLSCEAEEEWIRSMAIDTLEYGRHQPFYNALLSDGSRRYVAEENIRILYREYREERDSETDTTNPTASLGTLQFSELGPLGIETVGQYFESWDGQHGHYIMNKELSRLYPTEDFQ